MAALRLAGACHAQCVPTWSAMKRGAYYATKSIREIEAAVSGVGTPTVLYGGGLRSFGGAFPMNLAQIDAERVYDLGGGVRIDSPPDPVEAVKVLTYGGSQWPLALGLYVGGFFQTAGPLPVRGLARWDGKKWHDVGGGVGWPGCPNCIPQVMALALYSPDGDPGGEELFVGGSFESAGSLSQKGLARWNGTLWSSVGGGLANAAATNPTVSAMLVHDDDGAGPRRPGLYVGGSFVFAGGSNVNSIARWDGTTWEPLAQGLASTPLLSLAEFDEDGAGPGRPALFAGGAFKIAGNPDIWYIARWDGQAWSHVGPIFNGPVYAMTAFDDDGPGPNKRSLFAGGAFTHIFTTPYTRIARWDGSAWYPLETGVYGIGAAQVNALGVFDEDGPGPNPGGLHVGGRFRYAGGTYANWAARWGCPLDVRPCEPDCNNDGVLNLSDFGCFLNNVALNGPYADMDEDGLMTPADFSLFRQRFADGCP